MNNLQLANQVVENWYDLADPRDLKECIVDLLDELDSKDAMLRLAIEKIQNEMWLV